jgi:hypothetical protein
MAEAAPKGSYPYEVINLIWVGAVQPDGAAKLFKLL